jgi:hypothetical protein
VEPTRKREMKIRAHGIERSWWWCEGEGGANNCNDRINGRGLLLW